MLYIEDNASNLSLVEEIFAERSDIELLSAANGQAGLAMAREHRPNMVLLDLHLPDLDGDTLLQRLKEDQRTREIPVMMVSADATPMQIERLLKLGARAYLTKPLNIGKFLRAVDEALAAKA